MIQNLILPFITGLLPDILKRVLPEKISDMDKAMIERELTLELLKADWQKIEAEYADRNSARDLAKADIAVGNAFTGALAAIVRPLWGVGAFCIVVYAVVSDYPISAPLQAIIETLLVFYFGGRVVEKVAPTITGVFKK